MALVYTNDKCIGCNKCLRACYCDGACIAVEENGIQRINVDPAKCVGCGACIDVCKHNARDFYDDTDKFFEDLKRGVRISLLAAPAFKANYPNEYEQVLGENVYIRQIEGERHAYEYLNKHKKAIAAGRQQ